MSVLNLPCSICSGKLINLYEIFGANCGHLFHAKCISAPRFRSPSRRCPKCYSYASVIYKLYEAPEEIANINALEAKLKMMTTEKQQLKNDLDIKAKELLELQTASAKQITKLNSYSKAFSDLNNTYAQLKKQYDDKNKEISELQATAANDIKKLKSENRLIADSYDERITNLKENLADFSKDKERLVTELHLKNRQLEEAAKEVGKLKASAQASEEKANELLREHERHTSELKEEFAKEILIKNLPHLKTADIESKKRNIKLLKILEAESKHNKEMKRLKAELLASSDISKQQQVEIAKLTETIKNLHEQIAQQTKNVGVVKQKLPSSQSQSEPEIMETKTEIASCLTKNQEILNNDISKGIQQMNLNDVTEITQLKNKLKMLEQRLQFMSGEMDKEILKSTQLEVDKLKLQSYVDCMRNDIPVTSGDETKNQSTTSSRYITQKSDEVSAFKSLNMRRKDHDKRSLPNSSIIVQNYPRHNLLQPLVFTVMALGDNMDIAVDKQDIEKANLMGGEQLDMISLYIQFKTADMKFKFLTNQHKLSMGMIQIKEYFP